MKLQEKLSIKYNNKGVGGGANLSPEHVTTRALQI